MNNNFDLRPSQWVIGLRGTQLETEERQRLQQYPPKGIILFARNCQSAGQVCDLIHAAEDAAAQALWVAIDEEGGRVHRIPWGRFANRPAASHYGKNMQQQADAMIEAVYNDARTTGEDLKALGFSHDCAPVADLFFRTAHPIIGERAYAHEVETVSLLATAAMRGLHDAGICAIGKHFPGHGRANADSHTAVPQIHSRQATIFAEAQPFQALIHAGIRHIMTAHILYTDIDAEHIATCSSTILRYLRQQLGFTGQIWSDDLCMKGIGNHVPNAIQKALHAGCDVPLICLPEGVDAAYEALNSRQRSIAS